MSIAKVHTVQHARQAYAKSRKVDEEGNPVAVPVTSKRTGEQKTGRGGRPMTRRVTVANKEQPLDMPKCGKCGDQIVVGGPYRWFSLGFRSHSKYVRCMKSACTPKMSELESSKIAGVYAAQEDAEANLGALEENWEATPDDAQSELQTAAESIREVAEEYREAAEAMGDAGAENEERADNLDSAADELEGWSFSGDDDAPACEEHEENGKPDDDCADCDERKTEWIREFVDEARDALNNISV